MSEPIRLTGMVLQVAPQGETDRRLVLLTRERGKLTAFARGARKPNSPLLGATSPFVFGTFTLYEGRTSYTLVSAEIAEYFKEVREDFLCTCYACYFMELAEYYTRENLEAAQVLNLLYATLKTLPKKQPDNELVRCVFELKMMVLNGEYPYEQAEDPALRESTRYAIAYVISAPMGKLYAFTLREETFREFRRVQDYHNRISMDRPMKSFAILRGMVDFANDCDTSESLGFTKT